MLKSAKEAELAAELVLELELTMARRTKMPISIVGTSAKAFEVAKKGLPAFGRY